MCSIHISLCIIGKKIKIVYKYNNGDNITVNVFNHIELIFIGMSMILITDNECDLIINK